MSDKEFGNLLAGIGTITVLVALVIGAFLINWIFGLLVLGVALFSLGVLLSLEP